MPSKNDVTRDEIKTGVNSDTYRNNWEKIFKQNNSDHTFPQQYEDWIENPFQCPACLDHGGSPWGLEEYSSCPVCGKE